MFQTFERSENYRSNLADSIHLPRNRERGKIVTLKPSFGFIRSLNRPEQLFFHFTNVVPTTGRNSFFKVGDDVEFEVEFKSRDKRPIANFVRRIPRGSVVFEQLLPNEGRKRATVTRQIPFPPSREGSSGEVLVESNGEKLPFNTCDINGTYVRLLEGDKVEICVYIDVKTKRRGATQISLISHSLKNRERGIITAIHSNNYGFLRCADRNEQNLFFHFSERLDNRYMPLEGHGVEFNVMRDNNNRLCASRLSYVEAESVKFTKILPVWFKGVVQEIPTPQKAFKSNPSKLSKGVIAFKTRVVDKEVTELLSYDAESICQPSVNTKLMPNDIVQFRIAIYKPTGKRQACDIKVLKKAKQTTEQGIVSYIKPGEYGFIERPKAMKNLYFKLEKNEFAIDDCVEYIVIESKTGKNYADNVKPLPRGTVQFYDYSKYRFDGVILRRAATASPGGTDSNQNFSGLIGFCDQGKDHTIAYNISDLKEPKIGIKKGDIVSFVKRVDLRFEGVETASRISIEKPSDAETREKGIVMNLRSDFGFLTCAPFPQGLFFHFSNIIGDAKKRIKCCDEFSFDVEDDFRGKKVATRLLKLKKNTVLLDDVDPTIFVGKIKSTGYEFSRDVGFHGNGIGCLEYCTSEIYNDIILNLSEDTVINEKNNREIIKSTSTLPFRSSDLLCSPLTLSPGDFVRFQVVAEKSTGQLRAAKISLLPKIGQIRSRPLSTVPGEIKTFYSHEFFDFHSNEDLSENTRVIFDVLSKDQPVSTKREAFNMRNGQYLVLESGFYKGYIKELISEERLEKNGRDEDGNELQKTERKSSVSSNKNKEQTNSGRDENDFVLEEALEEFMIRDKEETPGRIFYPDSDGSVGDGVERKMDVAGKSEGKLDEIVEEMNTPDAYSFLDKTK